MSDKPTVPIRLEVHRAFQRLFEVTRWVKVKQGRRWDHEQTRDRVWTEHGRLSVMCPAVTKWNAQVIAFWIDISIPAEGKDSRELSRDEVRAVPTYYLESARQHLESETVWEFTSPFQIRASSALRDLKPPADCQSPKIAVVLNPTARSRFEDWSVRVKRAETKFNEARDFILRQLSEPRGSFEFIASELRAAARFIAECDRQDAGPDRWLMDIYPQSIIRHLEDLLPRKMPTSQGYRVDLESTRNCAYVANFPLYWKGYPPA